MQSIGKYNFEGERISSFGKSSFAIDGFSGCCNPAYISILNNGDIVTSEKGLIRVKVYGNTGKFKSVVCYQDKLSKETLFDVAVDNQDNILVVDISNKILRVFTNVPQTRRNSL